MQLSALLGTTSLLLNDCFYDLVGFAFDRLLLGSIQVRRLKNQIPHRSGCTRALIIPVAWIKILSREVVQRRYDCAIGTPESLFHREAARMTQTQDQRCRISQDAEPMPRGTDDNVFTDLSGTSNTTTDNPYDALLEACNHEPVFTLLQTYEWFNYSLQQKQIQLRYQTHRETRNDQQKSKLTSLEFSGFLIDGVLQKLVNATANPGYFDPRNCLVFWARPPQRIRLFVETLQKQLLEYAPSQ